MPTLSASFEQLKEIATLQEVADLSEHYTIDSAFESLCDRLDILDENIENLHFLQALVEKESTGPALEAFCGESFKETFGVENVSMESLTIAGVALVIWCILAICAIIEFFIWVFTALFKGSGSGGGGLSYSAKKSCANAILEQIETFMESAFNKALDEGETFSDKQLDETLGVVRTSMTVQGVTMPADIMERHTNRINMIKERIKSAANMTEARQQHGVIREVAQQMREDMKAFYKVAAGITRSGDTGGDEVVTLCDVTDVNGVTIIAPTALKHWFTLMQRHISRDFTANIKNLNQALKEFGFEGASCMTAAAKSLEVIEANASKSPENVAVPDIQGGIGEMVKDDNAVKSYVATLGPSVRPSLAVVIDRIKQYIQMGENTKCGRLIYTTYTVYRSAEDFNNTILDDLNNSERITQLDKRLIEALAEEILNKMHERLTRNTENYKDTFMQILQEISENVDAVYQKVYGASWDIHPEVKAITDEIGKSTTDVQRLHDEYKHLAENWKSLKDDIEKNEYMKFQHVGVIIREATSVLSNMAEASRSAMSVCLGYLSSYTKMVDNIEKGYKGFIASVEEAIGKSAEKIVQSYLIPFLVAKEESLKRHLQIDTEHKNA